MHQAASGTVLKIMAEEGAPAKVGTVLAFIGKPGEAVESSSMAPPTKAASKVESQKSVSQPSTLDISPATDLGFISPVVAKIAAEHGVNLQQVQGTGLNGRITKNDCLSINKNIIDENNINFEDDYVKFSGPLEVNFTEYAPKVFR